VQNGAKNGSKEAKPKKEKKELTQDKKFTAEKPLKPGRSLGISFPLANIKFLLVKSSSSTMFSSQNLNRSSVLLIIIFFPIIAWSIALYAPISASLA
jgi:hypothetical protein